MTTRRAELHLPYFKQGDDMANCLVNKDDGSIDAKTSIKNHIKLLEHTIEILQQLHDNIPDDNDISIDARTHCIWVEGHCAIITRLLDKEILDPSPFEDDED